MSSWVCKSIDTWSIASWNVNWTMSLSLLSWKPLYLYYREADEHLRYLETWKHSWQEIYQLKTKMNMRIDLQRTWVNYHEGCTISVGRSGERLPRLHKAQSGLLGDWLTTRTMQCIIQSGYWLLGLYNVQLQLQRNVQNSLGGQLWAGMHISGEEGEPSFPILCNAILVET